MYKNSQRQIIFKDLGQIDFKACWDLQEQHYRATIDKKIANRKLPENQRLNTQNYLFFCSHPHVYTLGKSGSMNNLLLNEVGLKNKHIQFYKINRGGDITYHGPGQIVGYPILDLHHFFTDIHKFMRLLEECIILTLAEYGIVAGRIKGATGVWIDADKPEKARKICAMGIRCSRWVTMHGWAFNVNADLSYFENIIPCGITDKGVTSLHKELGVERVDETAVKAHLKRHFANLFAAEYV